MKIRLAAPLQPDSIVDGEGVRTVVWTQGCSHNCKGCHNPTTHDFKGGFEVDTKELIEEIIELEGQEGITFSGGDPMFQTEACIEIAKYAKENNLDIWCYTGFKFEDIVNIPKFREFLKYIDVLVDGQYKDELHDFRLKYRGSSNQRVIDVKKSLKNKKVCLLDLEVLLWAEK